MYALLNRDELQSYLDSVNETWSTDASIEEFRPEGPDLYRIVVFGHRRTKAAMEVAIDKGFSLDDTYIDAQVLYHPSTHEILSAQLAEGIMIPPPPEREAALIENTYRTGLAVGRYESMADFERKSPMGISKITNAVHFMQLPDSVRELVADTDNGYKLNYTRALLLRRIAEPYGAWLRRHPNLIPHLELADYDVPSNEQIEKAVEERMFKALRDSPKKTPRCGDGLVERLPWSTAKLGEYVRDRIEFWTSDVAEDSLTLFESAAERSRKEREEADIKEMTRLLDGGVIYAKMLGQIAARMPERLKERTRAQRLRVASRLSRLSNVAEEASSAIYAQLADEE